MQFFSFFFSCLCAAALFSPRNDTAIASRNLGLRLSAERIIVAHLTFVNDLNVGVSLLCNKVDAGWAATIGVSNNPVLPHAVSISALQNGNGVASFVLDHPYSIGLIPRVAVRNQIAQLINQAGKTVSSSPATVAQAFLELAANGPLPDGNGFDLSNAQSAYAWPMSVHTAERQGREKNSAQQRDRRTAPHCCYCFGVCMFFSHLFFSSFLLALFPSVCRSMGAWLLIDRDAVQSTCATKAEVLKFLLWVSSTDADACKAKRSPGQTRVGARSIDPPETLFTFLQCCCCCYCSALSAPADVRVSRGRVTGRECQHRPAARALSSAVGAARSDAPRNPLRRRLARAGRLDQRQRAR